MYPGLPTVTAPNAVGNLAPPSGRVTNTAPSTRRAFALAMARPPKEYERIWGSLPVEEVEGHDVDPAYDVRPIEGLGRAPIRSEHLAGMGSMIPSPFTLATAAAAQAASSSQEAIPQESPRLFGVSTPYLVLAAAAAVALGMFLKR